MGERRESDQQLVERIHQLEETLPERIGVLVRDAVSHGIKDALRDEEAARVFWAAAFVELQHQAQERTGKLAIKGLKALAGRLLLFGTLGLVVYALGGWAALAALWKALGGGS